MLRAVIVGINCYKDESITDLRWARRDAEELAAAINTRIESAERYVRLLVDEEATKTAILKAIGEELPRLESPKDLILLYFAGHGTPELAGSPDTSSRYLVAHDTEYDSVFATGIDMENDLKRLLERLHKAGVVVIILDACFSGLAGGRTFRGPKLQQTIQENRSQLITLKDLSLGEGRVIIAACKDNQVAREKNELKHGLFTHHLMEIIGQPEGGATVTLALLYDQILHRVEEASLGRQTPVLKGELAGARLPRLPAS